MSDYKYCRWNLTEDKRELGAAALARHIDQLNPMIPAIQGDSCDVISFSHFLPRGDLLPEKRFLRVPFLVKPEIVLEFMRSWFLLQSKICGSDFLNERLLRLKPDIHVFGHTHIAWDITLDGKSSV